MKHVVITGVSLTLLETAFYQYFYSPTWFTGPPPRPSPTMGLFRKPEVPLQLLTMKPPDRNRVRPSQPDSSHKHRVPVVLDS